jgi:GT2 family glycosyltransferase
MFAAINAVVDKTSAEYIVITDSDCILAKDFLTQMKKAVLNKKDVAAFVGNVIRNSKNYFFKSITGYEKKQRDADADKIYSQLSPKVNFHTDSCVFRKDVFREMHGFAETLLRGGADTDFGFRLIKAGYGIGFVARALVYHYERNSITDLFKRYYNFGRWDCLNYREHFKNRLIIYLPFNKMYYFPFFWSGYIRLGHFECLTFIFLLAFYVPLWSLGLLLAYILIIGKIVSNLKIFVPLTVFRYISGAGYFFGNLSQSIKCIARSPLLKA